MMNVNEIRGILFLGKNGRAISVKSNTIRPILITKQGGIVSKLKKYDLLWKYGYFSLHLTIIQTIFSHLHPINGVILALGA